MTSYLLTFGLAVASVGLWTVRVAVTSRGRRAKGSVISMCEAIVFLVAFSHVTASLDAPGQILTYGLGVGAGTYVGITVDRRIKGGESLPARRNRSVGSRADASTANQTIPS